METNNFKMKRVVSNLFIIVLLGVVTSKADKIQEDIQVYSNYTRTVRSPPTASFKAVIIKDPSNTYFVDSSISLTCNVIGNQAPEVFWTINGENVEETEHIQILPNQRKLIVHRATADDSGRYSCHARKHFSTSTSDELQIYITPAVRAVIIKDPSNTYIQNSPISLTCNVSGNPAPEVFWRINGENVEETEHIQILQNQRKLIVHRATADDSGRYSCQARNNFSISTSDELTIDITPAARAVIIQTFSVADSSISLTCNVSGNPAPEVSWTINGTNVIESERITQIISETQHKLVIHNETAKDTGRYACHARNNFSAYSSDELPIDITTAVRAVIIKDPSNTYILNSSISLTCNVSGNPAPEVFWRINGENVEETEHIQILQNQRKLIVHTATAGDSGRYLCLARNNFSTSTSDELPIDITPPLRAVIIRDPLNTYIPDSSISLTCNVSGNTASEVIWTINGENVEETEHMQILANQRKLIVHRATAEDNGRYSCVARNNFSTSTSDELQIAAVRAVIIKDPSNTYILNSTISLTCNASGNPTPEVFWTKNGENVFESEHIQISENQNKLIVHRATADDSGRYSCQARNNFSISTSDELPIDITSTITAARAVIIKPFSVADSSISLTCNFSGNPAPEVSWTINGTNIVKSKRFAHFIAETQHKLVIHNATAMDTGRYACHARNNFSSYSSDELPIDITTAARAVIIKYFSVADSSISLTCNVSGNPAPEVIWTINGTNVVESEHITQISSENQRKLIVRRATAEDNGRYSCVARNNFSTSTSDELPIAFARAVIVKYFSVADSSISLTCNVSGNPAPEVSWTINGTNVVESEHITQIISENQRKLVIHNATTEDTGRYSCVARNHFSTSTSDELPMDITLAVRAVIMQKFSVENSSISLTCHVSGHPAPEVSWTKYGKNIVESERITQIRSGNQHRLIVHNADDRDIGPYKCLARNNFSTSASDKLIIESSNSMFMNYNCRDYYMDLCDRYVANLRCGRAEYNNNCCRSCTLSGYIKPGQHYYIRRY